MDRDRAAALPNLRGTTVIVTGGTGHVGAGISLQFALAGANVVVHSRRVASAELDGLLAWIADVGGRGAAAHGDIRDPQQCDQIVRAAQEAFGSVDALVNAAGIEPVQPLGSMAAAQWASVIEVNVNGTFAMTQAAASAMRTQGCGGSITHIASVEASLPAPGHAHYAASKAAVVMHARAAALEFGRAGIRVNAVSPGLVDEGGLSRRWPAGLASWTGAAPLGRAGTPQDIGNACVFLASAARGVHQRARSGRRRRDVGRPRLVADRTSNDRSDARGHCTSDRISTDGRW